MLIQCLPSKAGSYIDVCVCMLRPACDYRGFFPGDRDLRSILVSRLVIRRTLCLFNGSVHFYGVVLAHSNVSCQRRTHIGECETFRSFGIVS
jgi:hypothetical protein